MLERIETELTHYLEAANDAYEQGRLESALDYLLLAAERQEQLVTQGPDSLADARAHALGEICDFIEEVREKIKHPAPIRTDGEAAKDGADKKDEPIFQVEPKPDLSLDDVAGMHEVKEYLQTKLIDKFRYPEIAKKHRIRSGGGVLLYGPPGTGKTFLARAIAGTVDAAFLSIRASDLLDSLYGQTEKRIASLFAQARNYPQCVVFIDEVDALGSSRDAVDTHMRRFLNQFLGEMDGFTGKADNVLILGATNKPWMLDSALIRPGRMDELVYVPLPDAETRRALWQLSLRGRPTQGEIDFDALTLKSDGLAGADIKRICEKASENAYQREIRQKKEASIRTEDLLNLIPGNASRIHAEELKKLDAFARKHGSGGPKPEPVPSPHTDDAPHESQGAKNPADEIDGHDPLKIAEWTPQAQAEVQSFCESFSRHFSVSAGFAKELAAICAGMSLPRITHLFADTLEHLQRVGADTIPELTPEPFRQRLIETSQAAPADDQSKVPPSGESATTLSPESSAFIPAILKTGQEITERYGENLSEKQRDDLRAKLYDTAREARCFVDFDQERYAIEVISAVENAENAPPEPDGASAPATGPRAESNVSIDRETRLEALDLLQKERARLGSQWKTLAEEARTAPKLDLAEFSRRVEALAEQAEKQARKNTFIQLLQGRRNYLPAELREAAEAAVESNSDDLTELSAQIEAHSYDKYVSDLLQTAMREIDISPKYAGKILRKAHRKMTRERACLNLETARNCLMACKSRYERALEAKKAEDNTERSAAALVEDVNQLIIPAGTIDFSDVAGMDRVKDRIEDAMDLCLDERKRKIYLEKTGRDPKSMALMLYGCPGNGKTFIARAAAGEFSEKYGFTILHVPHDSIRSLHYTKKLTRIREIFELARNNAPALVIWDEFDDISQPSKFSGGKYDDHMVNTLKQEFEGVVESDKTVLHIVTTNYPWRIDDALIRNGRIGSHVHVTPPDHAARREIFELLLEGFDCEEGIDYGELATESENFTVAEIESILTSVGQIVTKIALHDDPSRQVLQEDLLEELAARPSRQYHSWTLQAKNTLESAKFKAQAKLFPDLLEDLNALEH